MGKMIKCCWRWFWELVQCGKEKDLPKNDPSSQLLKCKCKESKYHGVAMCYVGRRDDQDAWYCDYCGRMAIAYLKDKSVEYYAPQNWFPEKDPQ